MTDKPPFKPGDVVVRRLYKRGTRGKPYSQPFMVHICENILYYGWTVFDLHLNKFYAKDCVLADIYHSPLWELIQESSDE